jgi:exodeoxyribonuclease V gamma subunit
VERQARIDAALVARHELRRFHGSYFPEVAGEAAPPTLTPSVQPDAEREASARELRAQLAEHCHTQGMPFPDAEALRGAFQGPAWEQLRRGLGMLPVPRESVDAAWTADRGVLRVSMRDIRNFLECPLQGSARFLLRLGEDEVEDVLGQESELFEANQAASARLLQTVFLEKLTIEHRDDQPYDFDPIYDQRARWYELQGLLPTGPFYSATRSRHLKVLTTWQENLPLLGYGRSAPMQIRRFGRAIEHAMVDVPGAPLTLDVPVPSPVGGEPISVRVEIGGRTEVLLPESDAALVCHTTTMAHQLSPKYFLRGFMDHVFLAARGEPTPHRWTVVLNPAEEALQYKHKNCLRRFEPVDQAEAQGFLRDIVREMITRVHAYYLPVEVAFEHLERGEPLEQVAERRRGNSWDRTSADFGPVREPRRFELPDEADAIIKRRYGLYFERWIRGGRG